MSSFLNRQRILVDADAFVALYNANDSNHGRALKISEQINIAGTETATSYFVLSEAVTVISRRLGLSKAVSFLNEMLASKMLIFEIDDQVFLHAQKIYSCQTSKDVSFNDVINIALINQHNLDAIFSFDKHYKQNGIAMLDVDE